MQNNIIEDENFYKNICKKYINTMNIDRLLEGKRIIHFFINEDYVSFKVDSDVTFDEVKHIMNKNGRARVDSSSSMFFVCYLFSSSNFLIMIGLIKSTFAVPFVALIV